MPSRTSTRTRPGARFRRLARRFGRGHEKKAAIAVARTLICIAWAVMARGRDYADAGEDYYDQRDQRDREHLIRHHQQALARLGCQVTLIPPGDGTPPRRWPQPAPRRLKPSRPSPAYHHRAGFAGAAARQLGSPSFVTEAFVRRGLRLDADHDAGRPDLGILCVREPGGRGSLVTSWG